MTNIKVDSKNALASAQALAPEIDLTRMHPLVSWRSILAGLLISLFSLSILLSFGLAIGAVGLSSSTGGMSFGIVGGAWLLLTTILALFIGSYFAARISKSQTSRIGSAQGLVIASLFFGFLTFQTLSAVGWAGRTVSPGLAAQPSTLTSTLTSTLNSSEASALLTVSNDTKIKGLVAQVIEDLNLRSDDQTVVSGMALRLLVGDQQGARSYLARESGISRAEADRRLSDIQVQMDQAILQARDTTARALRATGWSLFATLLFGMAAAIGGGALGSNRNQRKPLVRGDLLGARGLEPARA